MDRGLVGGPGTEESGVGVVGGGERGANERLSFEGLLRVDVLQDGGARNDLGGSFAAPRDGGDRGDGVDGRGGGGGPAVELHDPHAVGPSGGEGGGDGGEGAAPTHAEHAGCGPERGEDVCGDRGEAGGVRGTVRRSVRETGGGGESWVGGAHDDGVIEREPFAEFLFEAGAAGLGVVDRDRHESFLLGIGEQPTDLPATQTEALRDGVLREVKFVIELSGAHGEEGVGSVHVRHGSRTRRHCAHMSRNSSICCDVGGCSVRSSHIDDRRWAVTHTTAGHRAGYVVLDGPPASDGELRALLHGLPPVDPVGLEKRAATLATRSIKTASKAWALDTIIRLIDLTTLEGADTPGKVRALAAKAAQPDPSDSKTPRVAAVCVYGDMVAEARAALGARHGHPDAGGIAVAAVATAFPSGRASLAIKLADTAEAVVAGADEIDMVIDRGAFLSGRYLEVYEQIAQVREACRRPDGSHAHLKVILETGELHSYTRVRQASWLAMLAGADFIKTSTGKVSPAATLPVTVLMLEAVRDWATIGGRVIGVKPAGGIRTTKDAVRYVVAVAEVVGPDYLVPHRFRFGASSLLNDVLLQRQKLRTGHYSGSNYVTLDV